MKTLSLFKKHFQKLDIKKGDKIVLVLDFLQLFLIAKKNKEKILPDQIIDLIIEIIGKKGTLAFNSFSWDFLKKNYYNYKKTKSIGGALSNRSLSRKDFKRTLHPIYSFSVYGKDSEKICKIRSMDSFGLSSVFGYMIKNDYKYVSVGVPLNSGFAFVHVAEQEANVEYRYLKKFSGTYIDKRGKKTKKTCSMFVRKMNLSKGTRSTKLFYNYLIKNNLAKKNNLGKIKMYSFHLLNVFKIMLRDLKSKRKFVISID